MWSTRLMAGSRMTPRSRTVSDSWMALPSTTIESNEHAARRRGEPNQINCDLGQLLPTRRFSKFFKILDIFPCMFQIHYGIFLDYYTANMLLDYFLEHQLYQGESVINFLLFLDDIWVGIISPNWLISDAFNCLLILFALGMMLTHPLLSRAWRSNCDHVCTF